MIYLNVNYFNRVFNSFNSNITIHEYMDLYSLTDRAWRSNESIHTFIVPEVSGLTNGLFAVAFAVSHNIT